MKQEKHANHVSVSGDKKHKDPAREKARYEASEHTRSDGSHPIMPYPMAGNEAWQQQQRQYSSQHGTPTPASSVASISAMLNPRDQHEYINMSEHPSTASFDRSAGSTSKMALHNALSPAPPTATPADNSYASVVLSDQHSIASSGDAYLYQSKEGYTTYASSEDFQRGKASLDYNYYYYDGSDQTYPHPPSSRDTDRRESGSSKSSKHYTASHAPDPPPREPSSKGIKAPSSKSHRHQHTKSKDHHTHLSKDQRLSSGGRHIKYTTPSSIAISSPAFSAPDTPGQQMPRLASVGTGSFGSSDNEYRDHANSDYDGHDDDEYDGSDIFTDSRGTSAIPRNSDANENHHLASQRPPAVQRERNRVAATKCRAKSKAAISKLEEDERLVSDRRDSLSAEKSALMNEVLGLRMELLKHGHCHTDNNIQNYLRNAARTIGDSGGSNPIWGPDGSGSVSGTTTATDSGNGHSKSSKSSKGSKAGKDRGDKKRRH